MRIYGAIQTKFWTNAKIQPLSDQAKLLASYLLCSAHTNMLGCFRTPVGYISEDLKWSGEIVTKAFDELSQIGFLMYDKTTSWVIIDNFLKYHPIENPNQGKSIAKLFDEIPKDLIFITQLVNKLLAQNKHLSEEFISYLETFIKPFPNQEQNKEQNREQKQELFMSGKPDVDPIFENVFEPNNDQPLKNSTALLKTQAMEILEFLNGKTGRVYRHVDTNLKLVIARLKSGVTVGQCFQIIAKKTREWKDDPKMAEYLRPATLFNATKFEQYIGELVVQPLKGQHYE